MEQARPTSALATLALALAGSLAAAGLWGRAGEVVGIDFYQFWAVGRAAAVAGPVDPYSPAGDERIVALALAHSQDSPYRDTAARYRRVLETYGSPLFYAAFVPLAWPHYETSLLVFQAASLAAGVVALFLLARAAGLPGPAAVALPAALLEWSQPLYADTSVGNVGRLQLACVCAVLVVLAARTRGRHLAAGFLLALAAAFKPTVLLAPVALAAALAVRGAGRDLLRLGAGLLGGLIAAVATAAALGFAPATWLAWMRAVRAMPESQITLALGNYGWRRLAADATGHDPVAVSVALAGLVLVAGVWRSRGAPAEAAAFEEQRAVALGCLAYLFAGRLVWSHYYLLATPAAVLALGRSRGPFASNALLALAGLGLTATARILAVTGGGAWTEAILLDVAAVVIAAALARTRAGGVG